MKIKKENKAIATTTNLVKNNHHGEALINKKVLQELLPIMAIVVSIGFWIKCCMAMADPIFLQKALTCSFIILATLFFKKVSDLK